MAELYDMIPVGRENAITREALCALTGLSDRAARMALAEARNEDNGDGFVIVSSSTGAGYYRTDDPVEIRRYVDEIEAKAEALRAPAKKARRILGEDSPTPADDGDDAPFECHLGGFRRSRGLKQDALLDMIRHTTPGLDHVAISKAENGAVILTPDALAAAAEALGIHPADIYPGLMREYGRVMCE